MALRGTLDTFALVDVIRLLVGTGKTGRLTVVGPATSGTLTLRDGAIVAGAATARPSGDDLVRVLFDLLRLDDGTFDFEVLDPSPWTSDEPAPDPSALLDAAVELLEEWRAIAAVVPSLTAPVRLVAELPAYELLVTADQWRVVVATGGGATVGQIGAVLGLDELDVSRAVLRAIEAGLVEVDDRVPTPPAAEDDALVEPVAGAAGTTVASPAENWSDWGATSVDEAVGFAPEPGPEPVLEPAVEPEPAFDSEWTPTPEPAWEPAPEPEPRAAPEPETSDDAGVPQDRAALLRFLSSLDQ